MTTKEWLSRGWRIDREIKELEQAQQEALTLATRTTAGTDGERVDGTSGNSSERAMVAYADKTAEYAALIEEKIRELVSIKLEIIRAVKRVESEPLREILYKRHINNKYWEQIACEMGYSYRQTLRKYKRALYALEDVIECHTDHVI